jgi:hypothetical protein
VSWSREFDDPIPLPCGRQRVTLEDAGNYITKLPKAEHSAPEWPNAFRRCSRRDRRDKSSGPPPFAPSLNVEGNVAHNNSGVFGDLTSSIAKQVPKVVRVAMGPTVFRIRIELIFRPCGNLITPSRSCWGLSARCWALRR